MLLTCRYTLKGRASEQPMRYADMQLMKAPHTAGMVCSTEVVAAAELMGSCHMYSAPKLHCLPSVSIRLCRTSCKTEQGQQGLALPAVLLIPHGRLHQEWCYVVVVASCGAATRL